MKFYMTYFEINFDSSAAGLNGNFGQVPYAAAKMGLVGLTKSIAIEGQVQKKIYLNSNQLSYQKVQKCTHIKGRKSNVHCNVIAPLAASRMTEKIFPSVMLEKMKPKFVAPLGML